MAVIPKTTSMVVRSLSLLNYLSKLYVVLLFAEVQVRIFAEKNNKKSRQRTLL